MNRGSQNRMNHRGGGFDRGSSNRFANRNQFSGSRSSSGQNRSNSPRQMQQQNQQQNFQQNQSQQQNFQQNQSQQQQHQHNMVPPSLMSPSMSAPFATPNQAQSIQNLLHNNRQQQNASQLSLDAYYALVNANANPNVNANSGNTTTPLPWASPHNMNMAAGSGSFNMTGFNQVQHQQAFMGQPPLPAQPQLPPPPVPLGPPPPPPPEPITMPSPNNFNNSNNERWNRRVRPYDGSVRNWSNSFARKNPDGTYNARFSRDLNNRSRDGDSMPRSVGKAKPKPNRQKRQSESEASTSFMGSPAPPGGKQAARSQTQTPVPDNHSWIDTDDDDSEFSHVTVCKKSKRKPMSTQNNVKDWSAEYATKALEMENAVATRQTPMLILKFPDPELSKEIVKSYSPFIANVHFQQPSTSRYCFIQLKPDADVDKVKEDLSKIPFGNGLVMCDYKNVAKASPTAAIEDIDPYTIYVGNLPTNVSVNRVKQFFTNAARIDIGFAQRMRYTRYAFVRYNTPEEAFAGFTQAFDMELGPRSLVIRFRRTRGNIGLNTNADGDESNKQAIRKRNKEIMDEEAIAADGGVTEVLTEDELARKDGRREEDEKIDKKDGVIEEDVMHFGEMIDHELDVAPAGSKKSTDNGDDSCAKNTDDPKASEIEYDAISSDKSEDGSNPATALPEIKKEPLDDQYPVAGTSSNAFSMAIKEEFGNAVDDDYNEYFDDMPHGDEKSASEDEADTTQEDGPNDTEMDYSEFWDVDADMEDKKPVIKVEATDDEVRERKVFETAAPRAGPSAPRAGPSRRQSRATVVEPEPEPDDEMRDMYDQLNSDG